MQVFLSIIQVIISLALIGLILIQNGKGAEVGAAFGTGASQTVFGSQGSGNFLTRTTAILATLFFLNCIGLSYLALNQSKAIHHIDLPKTTKPVPSAPKTPSAPPLIN